MNLAGYTLGLTTNNMVFNGTTYPYAINGTGQLGTAAAPLTISIAGTNALTIAAPISSGGGSLNLNGNGTVILGAASSYTGATNVNGGTLRSGIANALPAGTASTIAKGATVNLLGNNRTLATLAGAGTLTSSTGTATLTTGGAIGGTLGGTLTGNLNILETAATR